MDRSKATTETKGNGNLPERPRKLARVKSPSPTIAIAEHEITEDDHILEDLKNQVFSNDVIWRGLGPFLNVDDLKDCRLVCRNFNRKVIEATNFKDRTAVTLPLCKFTRAEFGKTKVKWRNVSLDVGEYAEYETKGWWMWNVERFSRLYPLLDGIESLKIRRDGHTWFPRDPKIYPAFQQLFRGLKNCRKLSVTLLLFAEFDPSVFRCLEDFVRNLTELELTCHPCFARGDDFSEYAEEALEVVESFTAALATNLRVLKCERFFRGPENLITPNLVAQIRNLVGIAKRSKETLIRLELDDPLCWRPLAWSLEKPEMAFPCLTALRVRGHPLISDTKFIMDFLMAQPALEELDVYFFSDFPMELIQVFRAKIKSLKILRLRANKKIVWPDSDMWAFLKEASQLKELRLEFIGCSVKLSDDLICAFLRSLPKTLEKVCLRGLKKIPGEDPTLTAPQLAAFNPSILTHLNLRRSGDFINDSTLEYICRNFKALKQLDLSNASRCSDYGFTGICEEHNESHFSLTNLIGLKSLALQNCKGITNQTLIDAIKFKELRYLDLSGNQQLTQVGHDKVIEQNPSLRIYRSDFDREVFGSLSTHEYSLHHHKRKIRKRISARLVRECGIDYCRDYSPSDFGDAEDEAIELGPDDIIVIGGFAEDDDDDDDDDDEGNEDEEEEGNNDNLPQGVDDVLNFMFQH